MAWVELNRVLVNNVPVSGEDWRTSDNFSLSPPLNTSALRWRILTAVCSGATFSIAKDIAGVDPTVLDNLASGSTTEVIKFDKLYVGGVNNAPSKFYVLVEGET